MGDVTVLICPACNRNQRLIQNCLLFLVLVTCGRHFRLIYLHECFTCTNKILTLYFIIFPPKLNNFSNVWVTTEDTKFLYMCPTCTECDSITHYIEIVSRTILHTQTNGYNYNMCLQYRL